MLDNVEFTIYKKFQKILMTGCRDSIKHQKCPKMGFSPNLWPPRFFFKNRALSLLYHHGALTSCKKLEKTNEQSLRYSKMEGAQTKNGLTMTTNRLTQAITKAPIGCPKYQIKSPNDIFHCNIWLTFLSLVLNQLDSQLCKGIKNGDDFMDQQFYGIHIAALVSSSKYIQQS